LLDTSYISLNSEHSVGDGVWSIKLSSDQTSDPMLGNFTEGFYSALYDSSTYAGVQGFPTDEQTCPEDATVDWEYFNEDEAAWKDWTTAATQMQTLDVDNSCSDVVYVNTNSDIDTTPLDGAFSRIAGGSNGYPAWSNDYGTIIQWMGTDLGDQYWCITDDTNTPIYSLSETIRTPCIEYEQVNTWTVTGYSDAIDIRFYGYTGTNMPFCNDVSVTTDTTNGGADYCEADPTLTCTGDSFCDALYGAGTHECCFTGCSMRCTQLPTPAPTNLPSKAPTRDHIDPDTCINAGYTNAASEVRIVGTTDTQYGCRGGLVDWWEGGKTCNSPYVVCLPEENTPNGFYYGKDHRYSLLECRDECALDQHCVGAEFTPDDDSGDNLGSCALFLSVPAAGYTPTLTVDLENGSIFGTSICMNKENYCNPAQTADDLDDEMLECYCPDNRKGTYTKQVTRTMATSRHCGGDDDMTAKIKLALANRMFEMCESWCLFDLYDPFDVAWFYDPWQECYREQYSKPGPMFHTLYCDAVVRDPYTVEMQYINLRAELAANCGQVKATPSPIDPSVDRTWVMAGEYESCTDACARTSGATSCDADYTATVDENMSASLQMAAFSEASVGCNETMIVTAEANNPAPAYSTMTGECLVFNSGESRSVPSCEAAVAATYMRLCACY